MPRQPARHAAQSELAVTFQHFADRRCGSYAPLYRRLGAVVAANTELLAIAATATAGQSVPDLMLAAVHYLIAREPTHPLARYYPTLTTQPAAGDPAKSFREFCLERHDQLTMLITTRLVQTNEVRRCCYLLPAVMLAARLAGQPIALIEPGASAGLNLALDHYSYDYDSTMVTGRPGSCLTLQCRLQGSHNPAAGPAHAADQLAGRDRPPSP